MKDHVFRMYDIRGEMDKDFCIEDFATFIYAFSAYLHTAYPHAHSIAVGRDGRTHSPLIHEIVCTAFQDSGLTVFDLGICPTPLINFALHTTSIDVGCMITASHNGPSYNGLKLMRREQAFWGAELQEIRSWYQNRRKNKVAEPGNHVDATCIVEEYLSWVQQHFASLQGMPHNIIFDSGNGATGNLMQRLLEKMQWKQATLLYAQVDGTFPHHEADPVVEKNMHDLAREVITRNAQYGIGFDGDGDRMGVVSENGMLLSGDQLFMLFTRALLQQQEMNPHIVFDAKCSSLLPRMIEEWGGKPYMAPSGYSNIRQAMRSLSARLGGELSCHFFFADRYFGYDDGIYAALRFIELMSTHTQSVSACVAELPHSFVTREWRIPCLEDIKQNLVTTCTHLLTHNATVLDLNTCDGVRATTADGWFLLRASHTQPVICIRCEATTQEGLKRLGFMIEELLTPHIQHEPFHTELTSWIADACSSRQPLYKLPIGKHHANEESACV